jgi:hypothetical protein
MRVLTILLFGLLLFGCNGFSEEKVLPGQLVVLYDREQDYHSLSYPLGDGAYLEVVSGAVEALWYNEDFIVAKQHPTEYPEPPDKSTTNYFIIPVKNKVSDSPDLNKIGPLNETQLEAKRKELGIPDKFNWTEVAD